MKTQSHQNRNQPSVASPCETTISSAGEVVIAAMLPHGWEVIPSQAQDAELMAKTRSAMQQVAGAFTAADLDVIIVLTPHGLRLKDYSAIYTCEWVGGEMNFAGQTDALRFKCDRGLASAILSEAEGRDLPVVGANFGALEGEMSCIDMDWGTFVPLWFLRDLQQHTKIVVINPTRDTTLEALKQLGEAVAKAISSSSEQMRVGLIASADQGHCHNADGPYGFNEASAKYDQYVNDCLRRDRLSEVRNVETQLVTNGLPDSLWQLAILEGAIENTALRCELLSYEAPTYFGMSVALFT